jgi:hypothetical protein
MLIKVSYQIMIATGLAFLLTACATEQKYRGVPSPHWQELTGEQKQLIVDQSYEQDFKPISKKPENAKRT